VRHGLVDVHAVVGAPGGLSVTIATAVCTPAPADGRTWCLTYLARHSGLNVVIAQLEELRAPMRERPCGQCHDLVPTVTLQDIQQRN